MDKITLDPQASHDAFVSNSSEAPVVAAADGAPAAPASGSPRSDAVGSESVGEAQIRDFFTGYTLKEVAFVYEPDGRPSGLAFAEFASRDEALQAMSKNGAYIGERYVRLLHVPKQEMQEQVRLGTAAIPGNGNRRGRQQPNLAMRGAGGFDPRGGLQGYAGADHARLPHGALLQPPQRPAELQAYGAPHAHVHVHLQQAGAGAGPHLQQAGGGGPMLGHGGVPQGAQQELVPVAVANAPMGVTHLQMAPPHLALAYQLGGMSLGGPPSGAQGGHGPHVGHTQQLVQQQGGYIGGGGGGGGVYGAPLGGGGYGQQVATAAQPVMVIGTESKTVKIRGLPFRATPLDIFNFFEGYDHQVDSLQLGVDALGRPSGEAWLTFSSCEEALRAVRERNRHYLGNRYLELSLT
ncbi:hypothetical protein MNEG_1601 [Monoraphidium neglectum]|uniref:RRM domain-containing protein n=1 Tax=Monoraphidium neglectum TaxID=145388 RepID=A0A0D2NPK1_9CHLO|nr:hypothetical protein MNEG_1601 [Monoraphidium neglectum]KIZ06356.1 hypothetical protein MNEG_1601 [Monoraphidium neglectum]|eukprot:XP_013905375.1 hypothetical protein MNEG_1601 [Monoraphidium neglectum]